MILLNFTHPIPDGQLRRIEALAGQPIDRVVEVPTHLDPARPFAGQATALADAAGLTPREWQSEGIVVVPPALNFAAAALLAEMHGRAGYFVPIVRTRPVAGSLPPRFEVAEIVDLQAVRDQARARRHSQG